MDEGVVVDEVYRGSETMACVIPARNGIIDCGATALMSESETVKDCVADCRQLGYPVEQLKLLQCRRPFSFGNGKIRACAAV